MQNPISNLFGLILMLLVLAMPEAGVAQETKVMVRAQSKDAKFIGTSMGGAKVIIRDATTGKILAEGITQGNTGNTTKIMKEPRIRNTPLTDENTAGFLAELNIKEPVFVTVEVRAPANQNLSRVTASTQLWVIPGKHITGDGLVLEIPGFAVDILSPQTHERIPAGQEVEITANIVMMCGCPITADGFWDANQYEITAIVNMEGESSQEIDLEIQEKPSTFSGKVVLAPGNYEVTVYAYDPVTGNTGLDRTNIIIQ
mgnify:CR=1 FL=1